MKTFTNPHCHSVYSMRDGLLKLEDAIKISIDNKEAFALTDHGSVAGWPEYAKLAKQYNIKPIFGVEIYLNQHRTELLKTVKTINSTSDKALKKELSVKREQLRRMSHHLVFIAKNETGFYNIIELMNDAYINYFYHRPLTDYVAIEGMKRDASGSYGIIVTTACLGSPLYKYILDKKMDEAITWIEYMKSLFGDDFYLEVQANNIKEQKGYNKCIVKLAQKTNTKMIIGTDAHYLEYKDADTHQDLLLLQDGHIRSDLGKTDILVIYENKNGETKRKKCQPGKEIWKGIPIESLKVGDVVNKNTIISIEETNRVWTWSSNLNAFISKEEIENNIKKYHPELVDSIEKIFESNCEIYDKIETIKFNSDIKLPQIENASKTFVTLVKQALKDREMVEPKYVKRAKYEMQIIQRFGFETYFLILHDVMQWARMHDIGLGAGRGSTCGSFIAYLLGIHTINPFDTRWDVTGDGLEFARFLDLNKLSDKIIVETDKKKKIEFYEYQNVNIKRDGKEMIMPVVELQENDVVVI